MKFIITLLLQFVLLYSEVPDLEKTINDAITKYGTITDYTCLLSLKELNGNEYKEQDSIILKFKKPASFYMKWKDGTEAIHVKGKNNNEIMVHLGGKLNLMNISLDPDGYVAMRGNRHAIYEAGIGHFLELIKKNYLLAKKNNELNIKNIDKTVFESIFPANKGYYAGRVVIQVDETHLLPLRTEVYDWNNQLLERYEFKALKINPGLTDWDFDTRNSSYEY